jgi:hypothetical protein
MSFNENAFVIATGVSAMVGLFLYIYDTRKDSVVNAYKSYTSVPPNESTVGGSKKHRKKNLHKKTQKQ